ncbi:MAG TPA: alpha-ribazole phosphatase family protein [Rhodocyclaceae bacterium]|nr:alpha-ribazole phosphatase family protein [Rhodocyclaceae bacterium]
MRLHLIRHPPPEVAPGVCYGRSDLALAEDAQIVAARLRPLLPTNAPVYSSPLQRCRQLADCLHPAPQFDRRLMEIDFGVWEMQTWQTIGRDALDAWAADPSGFAPPGGESPRQLMQRVAEFYREIHAQSIVEATAEVIVVTHAGVMKALHGLHRGLSNAEWMKLSFDYGSIALL